ncbi:MAG: thioredoxin family protein [Methanomicrobiales archaeon HGW-Methanomicrobiales-3]|jgi:small redox-active disulfide protein 2|nr:MAG: thioredoxin family protein [Methanomicrobiales archaeon HGW-Methanomicrobiales-3]
MTKIEVLGTGCAKCKRLFDNVQAAVQELGIAAEVVKVESLDAIVESGVMMTPALIINGEIVTEGRVPDVNEIKALVTE